MMITTYLTLIVISSVDAYLEDAAQWPRLPVAGRKNRGGKLNDVKVLQDMAERAIENVTHLISTEEPQLSSRILAERTDQCMVQTFDIFILQDTTQTFQENLKSAVDLMVSWMENVQTTYPKSRFGFGTFTDKPIPWSGFGPYGGWQRIDIEYDWCFQLEHPLGREIEPFVESLSRVWTRKGSGFDFQESQFEAMLRAVKNRNVQWAVPDDINPETNVRLLILITDATSHLDGDAKDNIAKYNEKPTLIDANDLMSTGGWGSHVTGNSDIINFMDKEAYQRLADLIATKTWTSIALSEEDQEEMARLTEYFGPAVFPDVVPHPGNDMLLCNETDYPTPAQVSEVLLESNVMPVILVLNHQTSKCAETDSLRDLVECPIEFYHKWLSLHGLRGLVRPFPSNQSLAYTAMMKAVSDAADVVCNVSIPEPMKPTESPATRPAASVAELPGTTRLSTTNNLLIDESEASTEDFTRREFTTFLPTETGPPLADLYIDASSSSVLHFETGEVDHSVDGETTSDKTTLSHKTVVAVASAVGTAAFLGAGILAASQLKWLGLDHRYPVADNVVAQAPVSEVGRETLQHTAVEMYA